VAKVVGAAAFVESREADYAAIEKHYRDLLEGTPPPTDLEWEPVRVGPTWQWDNGWLLPEFSLGWGVLAWSTYWLTGKNGAPWMWTPEQARFLLWFYAVEPDSLSLSFHSAVLQRLKGWGKDPLAAGLAIGALHAPVIPDRWVGGRIVGRDDPEAWTQIVAVSQEQTKNTMKLFPALIPADTRAFYGIQIGKLSVWSDGDRRQIEAITSNPLSVEGGRPKLIVRGETQNWNDSNGGHDMAGAMEGNAAKSATDSPARVLDICNAFRPGEDSVGQRVREGWDSTQGDDAAEGYGLLYDSLEAPPEAPLSAEAAPSVVSSIRGDSVWLDTRPKGRIVQSILNPSNSASESRRKWYNQIVAAEDALLDPLSWDGHKDKSVHVQTGEAIFMFFDGSKNDDHTALVGCRLADGHVFQLGVWRQPPGARRTDRWEVDRAAVNVRVRECMERYDVVGFWADPSDVTDDETGERFWGALLDEWHRDFGARLKFWAKRAGDDLHSINWDMRGITHQKMFTEAVMQFVNDVETPGSFTHDGAAMLTVHAKNGRRRPNKYGVGVGKEGRESARKIDLLVCAIGARMMRRLWLNREAKTEDEGWEVW
jgi:hypothetical protein